MKVIFIIILLFTSSAFASYVDQYLLEIEESDYNANQSQAGNKTRDALMSINSIQERADYFVYRLKKLTFGEYTEDIMIITPFITGEIEFNADQFNIYYNHFSSRAGVRYNVTF